MTSRTVHRVMALGVVVAALLCSASSAQARIIYRTCKHNSSLRIRVEKQLTCRQGDTIGTHGLRVDGQDGVTFHEFGRSWQCITIRILDHGQWSKLGCFTPKAPRRASQRFHEALVTLLIHVVGDVSSLARTDRQPESVATSLVYTGGALGHGAFQRRPSAIVYSGDGAAFVAGSSSTRAHLIWTGYTVDSAHATGAVWQDDCTPDCADGTYHSFFAKINLYRPQRIDGYRTFTRMAIHLLSGGLPYPGAKRLTDFKLRFTSEYGPTFFWADQ